VWSLPRGAFAETFFLGDDGRAVAVVAWRFVSVFDLDEPAVEIWTPAGLLATYSYRTLVAHPAHKRRIGPVGDFWRDWLDHAALEGSRLRIATSGPWAYELDLGSGAMLGRSIAVNGSLIWAVGLGLFVGGLAWLVLSWRGARRVAAKAERRRLRLAALGPCAAGLFLGTYLAGVPGIPDEWIFVVEHGLLLVSLVAFPISLGSSVRLEARSRRSRIALAAASGASCILVLGFHLFFT
jgi:hypothetical protein